MSLLFWNFKTWFPEFWPSYASFIIGIRSRWLAQLIAIVKGRQRWLGCLARPNVSQERWGKTPRYGPQTWAQGLWNPWWHMSVEGHKNRFIYFLPTDYQFKPLSFAMKKTDRHQDNNCTHYSIPAGQVRSWYMSQLYLESQHIYRTLQWSNITSAWRWWKSSSCKR